MSQPLHFNQIENIAYITLGANVTSPIGAPLVSLKFALTQLSGDSVKLIRTSVFYSTPAYPEGSGPDFVNAAVAVSTSLTPEGLLARLHEIEAMAGRTRTSRWAARGLDLDLVSYGEMVLPDPATQARWMTLPLEEQMKEAPDTLILPHPRIQDRGFALIPLRDVAPDWVHPVTGQGIDAMIAALPAADVASVRPIPQ